MREIKFRVWHYDLDRMDYNAGLAIEKGNKVSAINGEVMQYTGLKDKKGKEIYEADIIELISIDDVEPDIFVVTWEKSGYFTLKPFLDPEGYVPTLGYFTDKDVNDGYYSLEVVGNRYENPELVGEKSQQSPQK